MAVLARLLLLLAAAGVGRAGPGPPAALRFRHAIYNVSVQENSPPKTYAAQPPDEDPLGVRLPAPGAAVRFRVRSGDDDRFFKAEERTVGDFAFLWIRVRAGHAAVLNRERRDTYRLRVRAVAALPGAASLEAETDVLLTVTDANDLSPLFYPAEYDVEIPEDAAPHSSVARVTAEDADLGLAGEVYYGLAEPSDLFAVHLTSGVVTLARAPAKAEAARHELTVLARDRASLAASASSATVARARLTVRVREVNLHAPEIGVLRLPALETGVRAETVAWVSAADRDAGEAGRVASLEVVAGDPDGHFRVRAEGGGRWAVVAHDLVPRGARSGGYNLTLRARDAGTPPREAYAALAVPAAEGDDTAPVFARELYEASVPETAPPDTPVVRLKVNDATADDDARVYIEIVGGNEGGEFVVNPDTGVLYTARELDAELKARYTLTVSAVDRGASGRRKQSSAKVVVTVLDANDNDPVFDDADLRVTVDENAPAGLEVARLTARDADSGENAYVSYAIANLLPVPFEVDHFSGIVRTSRLLDYESQRREYVLRVRASDWGQPYRRQAEARLAVTVRDVNDNRPQFERADCSGTLDRRTPPGAALLTLSALDPDAGGVVSYRLLAGNDDGCFALDAATGVLTLACELGAGDEPRALNVTATDGTHFADPTTVTLRPASAPGTVECRDTGAARRLTDLLVAAERANVDPDPADDFPATPTRYGLNAHAPEFVDFPVEVKVNESVALGTRLVRLRARDRDLGYNGLLAFAISGGDPDSAFRVDPDTGELEVIGHLDRERQDEYFLNVTAYDLGRPRRAASRVLPVTVLDVNDHAPTFERAAASVAVSELAPVGTLVFAARARDPDAGAHGRVSYRVEGAAEFAADEDGSVRVKAALDRERTAVYELTVVAQDGGGRAARAALRVVVEDANDNAPTFPAAQATALVREDTPVGSPVAALAAEDPDSGAGGAVRYRVAAPEEGAAFSVDAVSGIVYTAAPLDFERRQVYAVVVIAEDGGAPPLSGNVTLLVEVLDVDENLHAPAFGARVLEAEVRENLPPGARVTRVAAVDRDGDALTYRLAGAGLGLFAVDDAGDVRTLAPLDRERAAHHWLTVCAEDLAPAPRHSCVPLLVSVADENDMRPWPELPAYEARVPEDAPADTRVVTLRAADDDRDAALSYRIVGGNPDGLFALDEASGALRTTGRVLDREAAESVALDVRVSDGTHACPVRVVVLLADVNDNAPLFLDKFISLKVPGAAALAASEEDNEVSDEDEEASAADDALWEESDAPPAPAELFAGVVLALDPDAGANGTVRYATRTGRRAARVHAASGRLYARAPLASYRELAVRACDGGVPRRCTAARVSLAPAPRTAPDPRWRLAAPGPLTVAELDPPGFLLAVLHPDRAPPLYYDIVDGDPQNEFYVGRENGNLLLAKRLTWERQAEYSLNVSATDGARTEHALVRVAVVNDAHEEGVRFERDVFEVAVPPGAAPGDVLGRLAARGPPGLRYGVLASRAAEPPPVELDETTAELRLTAPLSAPAQHELTVWARDQAPRAGRGYARVIISLPGAEERAPSWGRRLATARVPRGAGPGWLVLRARAAGAQEYSLQDAGGGPFAAHASLGTLTLTAPPPRGPGAPLAYTVLLCARGPGGAAVLPVHVTLVDDDAEPPAFLEDDIVTVVAEGLPAGQVVARLQARGPAPLTYSLADDEGAFVLSPLGGVLRTARALDHEAEPEFALSVRACGPGACAAAAVRVHVLDVNEHPPRFTRDRFEGEISESAAPGSSVRAGGGGPLVLAAADEDSPAQRRRRYRLPDDAARLFVVDDDTGALRTRAPLDYEVAREHNFTVQVMDAGVPPLAGYSSARVTVRVRDVNDVAPAFPRARYEVTLQRPLVVGQLVLNAPAADPDRPRGRLRYALEGGEDAFVLRGEGRVLLARVDPPPDPVRLVLTAGDGELVGAAEVVVRTAPAEASGLVFRQSEYRATAVENSTRVVTVAVLDVLGAELGEHVAFSLPAPSEHFEVGATSGAVRTTGAPLDRERAATHELVVQATSGRRTARAVLAVAVADVNDNCPVFAGLPYSGAVSAGAPPDTRVLTVRARDADAGDNGAVRYEMKRGHGELFRVDRRTGAVSLRRAARAGRYRLVLAAYDGGSPACGAEAEVLVRVWAGGAAPAWGSALLAAEVREDAAVGAALLTLAATSPLQRPLLYQLVEQDTPDLFYLHYDTAPEAVDAPCELLIREPLDYERARTHALVVRAVDAVSGAAADLDVGLTVLDVNDCAPRFSNDDLRAAVAEDAPVGTAVLTLHAVDADAGERGRVAYRVADDGTDAFAVDAAGVLRVARELDRERRAEHRLFVVAFDGGEPALSATAQVTVDVTDVNDCAPTAPADLVAAVGPRARRGTTVARVVAHDADASDADALRYRAAADGDGARAFAVNETTGEIVLRDPRAWASAGGAVRLDVTVSDGAHRTSTRVVLEPAPTNARPPRFRKQLYEARVAENEAPRTIVTVRADDEDAGLFGKVRYSIAADALREVFAIDPDTGELSTRGPLDREARAEWSVPVLAADGGARLAQAAVRVRVVDRDDNAPRFVLPAWRAAVGADVAAGDRILAVLAEDADERAELTYSLEAAEDGADAALAVDSASGAVSLTRPARAVAGRLLSAWAVVRDGAGHSARAALSVRVLPPGAPPPPPAPSPPPVYFLPESAAPGSAVASLPAEAGARFALSGEGGPFALGEGGALVLATPLDRESTPTHHVGVEVSARGVTVTRELRVHVLDDNDHAPRFLSAAYELTAAEDTPRHATLLQVIAEDLDAGSNGEVRYSLDDEAGPLAVDAAGGWVTLRTALDREVAAEHRAVLHATDGGSPARSATAALLLRVRDVNDNPPALPRDRSVALPEDAAAGTVLLALVATDRDAEPAPLRYYVVGGDPHGLFAVSDAGELSLRGALDRELAERHALSVLVADGTFCDVAAVRVSVLDVDDNPPVCPRQLYEVSLREDAAVGAPVVGLRVTDRDLPEHARVVWRLLGPGAELLAVDDGGRVTVAAPLDRETAARLALRAVALDPARPARNCSSDLVVALLDVNDNAPRFSGEHYRFTLPEDAEPGALAGKLHATDADLGAAGRVRYALDDASDALSVDADSGVLTLKTRLDRETTAEYSWTATASDAGDPPRAAAARVTLTVADVNDNPPEFEFRRYSMRASELDAVGTELLRVRATSRDAGVNADVRYSIEDGDERGVFELGELSGVLALAKQLDYERARRHRLTIKAIDGGTPPLVDAAIVDIEVIDGNDNTPTFERNSYAARVREDAPVGALVAVAAASDADDGANGRVSYAIVRGNDDGLFAVDTGGRITLAAGLDRELRSLHTLTVRARDGGTPALEAAAAVRVDVEDANDNAPRFSAASYDAVLQEDRAPGHALLALTVSDDDADPNAGPFTFDLRAGDDASAFRIEPDGTLRTAARFNRRARDRYDLVVRVFDNGAPPLFSDAAVVVRVVERSQHAPAVTPLDVLVVSYLDSFPGGVVGRVHAGDRDPYDRLSFSLAAVDDGPGAELFEIDSADGTLTAAPRPEPGEYALNATATDGRLAGHAPVRISVLEVTDEALADAVGARLREVTAADFVRDHRAGFCRGVAAAVGARPDGVLLLSLQAAGARRRRQVARDLDVLFAVRAPGGGYVSAEAVRRALHERLAVVEQSSRLVVERLARADCAGCARGQCRERATLLPGVELSGGAGSAMAAPAHRVEAACAGGGPVATLRGEGRLVYALAESAEDELALSLSVRTLARGGELARVGGRAEWLVLELAEGRALGRLQAGAGEARALAGFVADGEWHEIRLERRGAALSVRAGRHWAHAVAPAPHRVLDAPPALVVGAGLTGCVRGVRVGPGGGSPLPMTEGSRGSGGRLLRAEGVSWAARCPDPPPPDACSSLPCLNGGTCSVLAVGGAACECAGRFTGERCQHDPDPCAARPCLHGGRCRVRAGLARCDCPPGLTGERCQRGRWCPGACRGQHCEDHEAGPACRPRDACAAEPCRAGATCVPDAGGARCVCPAGATGADCGEPLTDAVQAAPAPAWERALRWASAAGWPLWAGCAGALLLLSAGACVLRAACRRRARPAAPPAPPPKRPNAPTVPKPSNLGKPAPLNNLDTLRSYGSAADELEALPPDYRRNLNLEADHKPWSEQMHLHTFTDNKIYNDLKKGGGCAARGEDARLVGGYHWDCSDWCAAPALLELPHSELHSSTPDDDERRPRPRADLDFRDDLDDLDYRDDLDDARYSVHPDAYLPRDAEVASLITLEERRSLLRPGSRGSRGSAGSGGSAALCEIEESDEEPEPDGPHGRHTDV